MAQNRDYRHWDEDWRGRRSQGEGEGGGRMESGFGDRGPNRYGGRDEWRASSFAPHNYSGQNYSSQNYGGHEDTSWRGRDEDRASRNWGGGQREHSGWGERSGRGEHGGSGVGSSSGSGQGAMGYGDWQERDRWRGREQGQFSGAGLTGGESGFFGGGPRHYGEPRGEYRGAPGRGYSSGQGGYGYGGRPASYSERGGEDRGFWDRASDEVQSWFGDEEAQHRRERDYERDHRGRGPRGYTRSDERIREDVCDRLEQDPRVDASDIDVKVSGGEVSLTGHVDSRMARRRAEDCAETISGVRHVQNNLRVQEYREYRSAMGSGVPTGGESASSSATGSSSSSPNRTAGSASGSSTGAGTGSGGQSASGQKPGS